MTAQSDIFAATETVTVATDILITVIVYNTSPPRVSFSALALACRWVQNQYKIHDGRRKTGSRFNRAVITPFTPS